VGEERNERGKKGNGTGKRDGWDGEGEGGKLGIESPIPTGG